MLPFCIHQYASDRLREQGGISGKHIKCATSQTSSSLNGLQENQHSCGQRSSNSKQNNNKTKMYFFCINHYWSLLYSAIPGSRAVSLACDSEWVIVAFLIRVFNIHRSGGLTARFGCYMAGATWNRCSLSALSVYTIQPCSSLQCQFIRGHIRRMHVCLDVICHLHFWPNKRDHSRAIASWPRRILPPLLAAGLDLATFGARVRAKYW